MKSPEQQEPTINQQENEPKEMSEATDIDDLCDILEKKEQTMQEDSKERRKLHQMMLSVRGIEGIVKSKMGKKSPDEIVKYIEKNEDFNNPEYMDKELIEKAMGLFKELVEWDGAKIESAKDLGDLCAILKENKIKIVDKRGQEHSTQDLIGTIKGVEMAIGEGFIRKPELWSNKDNDTLRYVLKDTPSEKNLRSMVYKLSQEYIETLNRNLAKVDKKVAKELSKNENPKEADLSGQTMESMANSMEMKIYELLEQEGKIIGGTKEKPIVFTKKSVEHIIEDIKSKLDKNITTDPKKRIRTDPEFWDNKNNENEELAKFTRQKGLRQKVQDFFKEYIKMFEE